MWLFVTFQEQHVHGGGTVEGQENDSWPDRTDSEYDFEVKDLYLETPHNPYYSDVKTPEQFSAGDRAFIVVVRYGDGDTFGHSSGHGTPIEITKTLEEAEDIANDVRASKYTGEAYRTWEGYFNSLESVEIHERCVWRSDNPTALERAAAIVHKETKDD